MDIMVQCCQSFKLTVFGGWSVKLMTVMIDIYSYYITFTTYTFIIFNYYINCEQMTQINPQLMDFDPTESTASTSANNLNQQQYPEYSDSSQSENQFNIKSSEKNKKLYHMNTFTKLDGKLSLHMISNAVEACENKQLIREKRYKDKSQRATVELVLDPRTRLILLKLLSNGTLSEVNGCLSTGKQANVYHAKNQSTNKEYAIKIYKTSILVFKDRERYVEGEYRFRNGHNGKNPRKMVKMWAQKEFRNLKRINGKIPSPVPLLVKTNVLVMDFIGRDVKIAPKLKQVNIPLQQMSEVYLKLLIDMRIMYQDCKLVHADLSQYNLLYFEKVLYMIDVSQAVEHDHPNALDFLRRDIRNINDFFKKKGVHVFKLKAIFQFIALNKIKEGQEKQELQKMIDDHDEQQQDDDDVFGKIHIPHKLEDIPIQNIQKQIGKKTIQEGMHHKIAGISFDKIQQKKQLQDDSSDEDSSQSDDQQQKPQNQEGQIRLHRGGETKYDGLSKLQRKHKVKQQKREKRKDKVPKHIKKQKTKKK